MSDSFTNVSIKEFCFEVVSNFTLLYNVFLKASLFVLQNFTRFCTDAACLTYIFGGNIVSLKAGNFFWWPIGSILEWSAQCTKGWIGRVK